MREKSTVLQPPSVSTSQKSPHRNALTQGDLYRVSIVPIFDDKGEKGWMWTAYFMFSQTPGIEQAERRGGEEVTYQEAANAAARALREWGARI